MNCLVVAATTIEIRPFLEQLKTSVNSPALQNADLLITGIGLTATTYSLSRQIQIKRPDLVIQAGLGGSFDRSMPLGTVVAVKQETIADQSVMELDRLKTLFDLDLVPANQYPYRQGWLKNKSEILKQLRLPKVNGISVNEITTSKKKEAYYKSAFNPVVESMEGAALHYVCLMEQLPFLQLRAISNYIAERNRKKWDMKNSIGNLNATLINVFNKL